MRLGEWDWCLESEYPCLPRITSNRIERVVSLWRVCVSLCPDDDDDGCVVFMPCVLVTLSCERVGSNGVG